MLLDSPPLPRVAFDCDIFMLQRHGGIRLYFSELIKAINEVSSSQIKSPDWKVISEILPAGRHNMLWRHAGLLRLLGSFLSPLLPSIWRESPIVYHASYYRNPFIRLSCNPVIVTVHDLIHELCSAYFESSYNSSIKRYVAAKRRCIYSADAVILVSKATLCDLLEVYPLFPQSKLHVIHHGADHFSALPPLRPAEHGGDGLPFGRYILYVGSRNHYKGFADLLLAMAHLVTLYDCNLICVGAQFGGAEQQQIFRLGLQRRVAVVAADSVRLSQLYQSAVAFVYPSWREGFGLPILEAMRSSCPVICSDIPSSREIADGYAMFFSPRTISELIVALSRVLEWPMETRCSFTDHAQQHAATFTWAKAARRTCDVYLGALSNHKRSRCIE